MTPAEQRVRGAAFLSARAFVIERYGSGGLDRVLADLDAAARAAASADIDRDSWVSFDAWVQFVLATDRVHGSGDLALARAGGRWGALADLGVMFPELSKTGTPDDLVELASRFWSSYYDGGRAEAIATADADMAVFEVIDFPVPHAVHCHRVVGWIEGAYAHIGIDVEMTMPRCRARGEDRCLYIALGTGAGLGRR